MMTSKERVEAAFRFEEPDKIPVAHIGIASCIASALLGREAYVGGGIQQWREATALWNGPDAHAEFMERTLQDAIDIAFALDDDIIRPTYWRMPRKPTTKVDEVTFLYEYGPEEEWKMLRYDPESEQAHTSFIHEQRTRTIADLEQEVADEEVSAEAYQPGEDNYGAELNAARLHSDYAIRTHGCYLWLPRMDGAWFMATMDRPDLTDRMMDASVVRAKKDAAYCAAHGLTTLFGGNDFASNDGPMFSPGYFRDHVFPRVKQLADICHEHGCRFFYASDGNLWPVADDLFGASGVDGYFEIDGRAGMDLPTLRERFPELILIGNMSSQTIHLGTLDEIEAEALTCLQQARECRGVIAGVSNYFVPGTPMENVELLLRVIEDNR
jgi:Uroporphyrinogen decarboxylase (URO-D)